MREDVPESHQAKAGTPSMGGVLIVLSITASVLIWQDPSTRVHLDAPRRGARLRRHRVRRRPA
ncbi:MAG: hypothetical protein MZV64_25860 [Ignavibacteriales bacterium]|nr:hypothetical protein [Ignavibacteriales bacterium]